MESRFVCRTALPLTLCPGLAHCSSPIQSQVQTSQVSVCQFNRASGTVRFCADHCGAPLRSGMGRSHTGCWLHQSRSLAGVPHLFYIWEFPRSVGNKGPSGNASLTHLLHASSESLNPGLFSQRHLESSSCISFLIFLYVIGVQVVFGCMSKFFSGDLRDFDASITQAVNTTPYLEPFIPQPLPPFHPSPQCPLYHSYAFASSELSSHTSVRTYDVWFSTPELLHLE